MPPSTVRSRPDAKQAEAFAVFVETTLDRAAAARPNPGRAPVHRLNRAEYSNAVRDLLAVDVRPGEWLPVDDSGYGFDNIAAVLSTSPALLDKYMSAARKVSRLAVGDLTLKPVEEIYDAKRDPNKGPRNEQLNDDLPFDSRAGMTVEHYFPLDAEYVFKVRVSGVQPGSDEAKEDPYQVRVPVKAGLRTIGVTSPRENLKREADAPGGDQACRRAWRDADSVARRPAAGWRASEAIRRARPIAGGHQADRRRPVRTDGTRRHAEPPDDFRVPPHRRAGGLVRADDSANARAPGVPASGDERRHPAAVRLLREGAQGIRFRRRHPGRHRSDARLAGVPVPHRAGSPPSRRTMPRGAPARQAEGGNAYRISDVELASRLSFFLWSTIPDAELLDVAERGRLSDPAVLERQVRRMLDDPRADALVSNFAGQWLQLRNVETVKPDPVIFPFDEALRRAFLTETELFVSSLVREDRSLLDLISADYTFVNQRLAEHYGIPRIYGSQFRRVTLPAGNRRGLLGQGSVLTVTSYPNRTSVVQRGKWVLENLLGTPPPPPPPDVPELKAAPHGKVVSMREQMQAHRANPTCAACHARMDPIGFALENYDGVGRWRDEDAGAPIDASGKLPDGTGFNGPAGLNELLLTKYRADFVRTSVEKLLTYALGRGVDYHDYPTIRSIDRDAARDNYRISSLILAIVKSTPFQMRRGSDS